MGDEGPGTRAFRKEQSAAMERAKAGYDIAVKIAMPILLAVSAWTFTQLWTHEGRLTTLEVRSEGVKEDLQEIKADVKTLLTKGD